MCQAKVMLLQEDESKLLLDDVIHIKVDGDEVLLSTFFEPPISVHATIMEADFLKHTVTLKSKPSKGY